MASKDRGNDTEDKKNKYCSDAVDCIDKYLSIFVKVLPFMVVLATLPLYYYAHEENINIFSHYSSWVSFLPVIASLEILMGLLLLLFVFSPGIQVFLLSLLGEKEPGFWMKVIVAFLNIIILGLFSLRVFWPGFCSKTGFGVSISIVVLSYLLIAFCFSRHKNNNSILPLLSVLIGATIVYISLLVGSLNVYFVIVDNTGWGLGVLFILYSLGVLFMFLDRAKKNHDHIVAFKLFIVLVAFISLFITPFSTTISGSALNVLQLGGGVERVYVVNKYGKSKIPSPFIDNTCCDDYGFCLTEKLSLKWALGDLVYVSLVEEETEPGETETDKEKTSKQVVPKQTIALPQEILFPYSVDKGDLMGCKTQQKLIEAANKENEGQ